MHKPPEGRGKCEGRLARGMLKAGTTEEDESDWEMEAERQAGKREVEKFVHGIRNGEIVGGPANERRMQHATRAGKKPSFWTYLKESGCRGCLKPEVHETIQHVLGGGCEAVGKNKNSKYRDEMRRILEKWGHKVSKEEELALRQMISGIIPEWQNIDDEKKRSCSKDDIMDGRVDELGENTYENMDGKEK
eukprot:742152-Pleurochrysis_carterae.AAC.3